MGNTTTNGFVDSGLTFDTTYYYKMAYLYGGITESQSTGEFTVNTSPAAPVAPTAVTGSAIISSQIKLSWSKVAKAKGYKVYRVASGSAICLYDGEEPTYTDKKLTPDTTYAYKVTAYYAAGESEPVSLAVKTYRYDAPSNFMASQITDSSVLLSWDPLTDTTSVVTGSAVTGATVTGAGINYKATRASSYSGTYTQVYYGSDTSFVDSGLTQGTGYYYKITVAIGQCH